MRNLPGLLLGAIVILAGCNRPSEDECNRAVESIQRIHEIQHSSGGPDAKAAVRQCRAWWNRAQVTCAIQAKSLEELAKCETDKR